MQEQNIIFFLIASSVAIFIISLGFILFVLFFFRSKKKSLLKALRNKMEYQYQLAHTQREVRQNTLNYISQELHDNVGQLLVVANLCSAQLKHTIHPSKLQELDTTLAQAATEVRQIAKSLQNQNHENFDLCEHLQMECERIEKIGGLQFHLSLQTYTRKLSSAQEIILYRIIQEFIANTLKHAQATTLTLSLRTAPEALHLALADNGIGYTMTDGTGGGSGLRNRQARAALLGATLSEQSQPKQGTRLHISIPYKKQKI